MGPGFPKVAQDGPKIRQDGHKEAPGGRRVAPDGPRWSQDDPKMAPRWPQEAPRWTQDGSRMWAGGIEHSVKYDMKRHPQAKNIVNYYTKRQSKVSPGQLGCNRLKGMAAQFVPPPLKPDRKISTPPETSLKKTKKNKKKRQTQNIRTKVLK